MAADEQDFVLLSEDDYQGFNDPIEGALSAAELDKLLRWL